MKNKIIDIICFVGGSAIFTKSLFNFESISVYDSRIRSESARYYTYLPEDQYLLTIGVCLIILGFLIRSWRKGK